MVTVSNPEFTSEQFVNIPRPAISHARLSGPNRSEISDASGLLAVFTDGSRTVRVRRVERTFQEQISVTGVQDEFVRTVSNGWGSTEASGRWTIRTGADADFSVQPGHGKMNMTSVNASRRIAPSSYGYDYAFIDAKVQVQADKTPYGDRQQFSIMGMYQDTNGHYLATLSINPNFTVNDDFERGPIVGNWGSAPNGAVWALAGGDTSADYRIISTGYAAQKLTTNSVSRRATIPAANDHEVYTAVGFDDAVVGGSVWAGVILRWVDGTNYYTVRVRRAPSGDAELSIQKLVDGTATEIGTPYSLGTMTDHEWWRIRARIEGNEIKAKAWQDIDSEPGSWQMEETDDTHVTGTRAGLRSILSSDYSGAPYEFAFSYFNMTDLTNEGHPVSIALQKREGGVTVDLDEEVTIEAQRTSAFDWFMIRMQIVDGWVRTKAWKFGDAEPDEWAVEVEDSTFTQGDVGLRGNLGSGYVASELPVLLRFADYQVLAEWINPPTITHDWWVYLLDAPYGGIFTPEIQDWLYDRMYYGEPDLLATAQQYVANAPDGFSRFDGSRFRRDPDVFLNQNTVFGDADYGPRAEDGARIEGGDFNDFFGEDAVYDNPTGPDTTDTPEAEQIRSLDCSGFVRMLFGFRHGMKMELSHVWTDGRIPRTSSEQSTSGPGVVIHSKASKFTSLELAKIAIGDVVFFDATADPGEEEGQIDHNGIYMGVDSNGDMLFISSRKTVNGPTYSAVGGTSKLNGSGLYANQLRVVRRY